MRLPKWKELTLDIRSILEELRRERDRIDEAISALQKVSNQSGRSVRLGERPRRRRLTPEGRRRLSEMMKKRWAERKRRAKAARAA
jgi:hypothetical protein